MVNAERAEADRQLPLGEEIFLDHVGHFVPDREAASHAFVRCGFAPTPVSVQVNPDGTLTGTGNVCAMFARGYVEVLFNTAATPLAAELDLSMARYRGVHLAAFAVADAGKAHARLGAAGFALRPLVNMQRPVDTEAGPATAVLHGRACRARRHGGRPHPDPYASHRGCGLAEALARASQWRTRAGERRDRGARCRGGGARFARFTGRHATPTRSGQMIALDRGRVELVSRAAFEAALPEIAIAGLPFIGAYGIVVASLDAVAAIFARAGLHTRRAGDFLVAPFPEELGQGAWLFTEKSEFELFG